MSSNSAVQLSGPDNGIVHITLSRPEQRNALRESDHQRLSVIWDDLDKDADVRVVVVHGAGQSYGAGGDPDYVRQVVSDEDVRRRAWWEARSIVRGMIECRKPIVSAVEGAAVGAGCAIALLADICIVAEDARLIDGHLAMGVSPGDHAAFLWPLAMGIGRARGHLLLGRRLSGAEAAAQGLVYEAVAPGTALQRADELAAELVGFDAQALAVTKLSVNAILRQHWQSFEAALALEFMLISGDGPRAALASLDQA
ncbi:enoyl-CoA hydratase-related protein [Nocardioides halotolerans]|uniref:enoyl-CoA hydratase-related protein n=1 Tax=Nocardioides halotolerans TaxID=433660 RepID=UPI00048BA977|nr:enoyl-CoA hydratase-related protein [Nocardioides halotolerans]